MKRFFSSIVLALVAALALTGCGSGDSSGGRGSDFNKADVTFAQSMIPHHQQAVQMAKMAKQHASTAEVKDLADKIESAQGPEIMTMQGWLKGWGKSEAAGSMSDMAPGTGMPGMMSAGDMSALGKATGVTFDKMFLTMMIGHHNGAIQMAKTEQATGKNADATALAKKIQAAQSTEIAQMKKMLTT